MVSCFSNNKAADEENKTTLHIYGFSLQNYCLRRESLWPGDPGGPLGPGPPRGPPQGGGYYIDAPDPFWAPVFLNFKPVF